VTRETCWNPKDGPRFEVCDSWTHLDLTGHEYDLRWVYDRHKEDLVVVQYATGRAGWRDVTSQAHLTDVTQHLEDNEAYGMTEPWDEGVVFTDTLPEWARLPL
jgi:hypothetical protein